MPGGIPRAITSKQPPTESARCRASSTAAIIASTVAGPRRTHRRIVGERQQRVDVVAFVVAAPQPADRHRAARHHDAETQSGTPSRGRRPPSAPACHARWRAPVCRAHRAFRTFERRRDRRVPGAAGSRIAATPSAGREPCGIHGLLPVGEVAVPDEERDRRPERPPEAALRPGSRPRRTRSSCGRRVRARPCAALSSASIGRLDDRHAGG